MELKDFVSESLTQIASGIKKAQEGLNKDGSGVCPSWTSFNSNKEPIYGLDLNHCPIFLFDFDVAVAVTEQAEKGGSIGVSRLIMVTGKLQSSESTASESRIRFQVPFSFPKMVQVDTPRSSRSSDDWNKGGSMKDMQF